MGTSKEWVINMKFLEIVLHINIRWENTTHEFELDRFIHHNVSYRRRMQYFLFIKKIEVYVYHEIFNVYIRTWLRKFRNDKNI